MRIIGGRLKGLKLASVGKGDSAAHLRPTADRVRESLFGMLEGGRFGDQIENAHVLDLFAGTGALGIEALSRGARHTTFVENGRASLAILGANIAKANMDAAAKIMCCDVRRLPVCGDTPASLVFLDPPYNSPLGTVALKSAKQQGWLAPGSLIVWENAREVDVPDGFHKLEARRFGQTWLNIFRSGDRQEPV